MNPKNKPWIERLNDTILASADNLPAALAILIGVYVVAEAHNYAALRDFAAESGVPWALSYTTPIMLGAFVFVIYWILVAYKAKGYNTALPWLIVIAFVSGSAWLNILHFGRDLNHITMALLSPLLILFGGWLAKDVVSKQVAEQRTLRSLKMLKAEAQTARSELQKIQEDHAQAVATAEAEKAALQAKINDLRADVEQLSEQRRQAKLSIGGVGDVPETIREAIQSDALVAAGFTQDEVADLIGRSRNTVANRLKMINGAGLRGGH